MVRRVVRVALALALTFVAAGGSWVQSASAAPRRASVLVASAAIPSPCVEAARLPHGARALNCVPASGWNGDLFVWAHGYVAYNSDDGSVAPLDFYHLTIDLPDGSSVYLPDLVQGLGYAFTTTSYRQNGLTVLEGVDDVLELVTAFPGSTGRTPNRVYMVGASEGGIITTLLIERDASRFSGALGACGPIGDFRSHINYLGDFRVLFDYFFPGVIPGSPIDVPPSVIAGWETTYKPAVEAAVQANPNAARQLIATSGAPTDPADPTTVVATTTSVLWYDVFGTNDARNKLGGNPFGNRNRIYRGSDNDVLLNARVARFDADPVAVQNIGPYQTSGLVTKPLVTLHTTRDEQVPFWHELLYRNKVNQTGSGAFVTQIPIGAYGHCAFTPAQLLGSFGLLVQQVTGSQPPALAASARIDARQARTEFDRLFAAWTARR